MFWEVKASMRVFKYLWDMSYFKVGWGWARPKPGTQCRSPTWVTDPPTENKKQTNKKVDAAFQVHQHGVGLEVEQPGLGPALPYGLWVYQAEA